MSRTLQATTTRLILLAYQYDNKLPYDKFKEFGAYSSELRRKFDVLNVLKAISMVERRGAHLYFHPCLIECINTDNIGPIYNHDHDLDPEWPPTAGQHYNLMLDENNVIDISDD